ncbi:hypothetical protein DSO57_1025022 [Entomophthora muscae]|uniref:Uncharacterized protein n=1 Tax=Entomophthora muscae TaxID=34485 RepID=A0ACC2UDA7_9FUNG|nr:hypothetical protein DSO57_1025022 [Entomophthora muscae]
MVNTRSSGAPLLPLNNNIQQVSYSNRPGSPSTTQSAPSQASTINVGSAGSIHPQRVLPIMAQGYKLGRARH